MAATTTMKRKDHKPKIGKEGKLPATAGKIAHGDIQILLTTTERNGMLELL